MHLSFSWPNKINTCPNVQVMAVDQEYVHEKKSEFDHEDFWIWIKRVKYLKYIFTFLKLN
jgi:hypothetical protein